MKRSWTAQGAAAQRAVLTDLGVLRDTYARTMLTPGMAATSRILGRLPRRAFRRSVTLAGAAGSILWIDRAVAMALDDGLRQVATVGASYDSRAWRFAREGVQFFELDHAASQAAKRHAAPGPGPTYVEADLRAGSAAESLLAAGLDPGSPAVVVVEAVTMYLTEDVVRHQLEGLASSAASGSRLVVNFLPAGRPLSAQTNRQLRLQRLAHIGTGEGFTFGIDPEDAVALVESTGWSTREVAGFRDAAEALVPPDAGLPVGDIDNRKIVILAER
ncbi:MAG TPA: SAM-dependent methyltransferase [Aquihabitans sp.]|jgi:methyltransferase (TIGR00027 family)|nr:SAM-dependent methyltransferase [Aquihabitans sp.]